MPRAANTPEYLDDWRAREGLYVHATIFVLVNATLLLIDALTPGSWWFFWPLAVWGVALGAHALIVLGARHHELAAPPRTEPSASPASRER